MAGRKWNGPSVAEWIIETAQARAEAAAQSPIAEDLEPLGRLASLSSLELQSLGVRLARYAWNRRLYSDDLLLVSRALLRAQASAQGELAIPPRAFLSVLDSVLEALRYGEMEAVARCEPWRIEQVARDVWRDPKAERQVVDTLLVRSMLEPLLVGDRPAFRSLLATIGREVVTLAAAGTDGRLPGVTESYGYAQLRSLQNALNGILQASRVSTRVPNEARTAV